MLSDMELQEIRERFGTSFFTQDKPVQALIDAHSLLSHIAALTARLERAEKVCEAAEGRVKCVHTFNRAECVACPDFDLCAALKLWREGRGE